MLIPVTNLNFRFRVKAYGSRFRVDGWRVQGSSVRVRVRVLGGYICTGYDSDGRKPETLNLKTLEPNF